MMELIEDLGMHYVTEDSIKKVRLGRYQCKHCKKLITSNTYNVRHNDQDYCRNCATTLGNIKRKQNNRY